MRKSLIASIIILFVLIFLLRSINFNFNPLSEKGKLTTKAETQIISAAALGEIKVWFCPQEKCEEALVSFLDSAQKSIHCALFEINLDSVRSKLLKKAETIEVQIVTDNQYLDEFNYHFVKADRSGLMHNKFCIVDGIKISGGSMNPTNNCAHKNNNNFLIIDSIILAQNYEDEFQEMWNGTFKKGAPVRIPIISLENPNLGNNERANETDNLEDNIGNTIIENYFCPEDHCADKVKKALKKAENSIYFLTFSFTHDGIGNILLLKNLEHLTIKGVMETKQVSKDSEYQRLKYNGIDVLKDGNSNNMHHKVFIIDEKTVVTGSFNPTDNGDQGNDENLLIIHDEKIARKFLEEFWKVWGETNQK